ncbi:MAG: AraC family transcriptional regulator [Planctomycetota bacterium]
MAAKTVSSTFRQALFPDRSAVVGAGTILAKSAGCHDRDFPHYALVFITDGGGVYEDPAYGRREVNRGDAILVFPHRIHSYFGRPGVIWSESFFVFQGRLFETLEAEGLLNPREPVLSPGFDGEMADQLEALYQAYKAVDSPHDPVLVADLHALLARIRARHEARARALHAGGASAGGAGATGPARAGRGAPPDFLTRACRRLEADLRDEPAWEALAAEFNLSYERFRKRFQQAAGVPPARYRLLRRIDRAKRLLIETDLSVKEIAAELGFCDPFFFSRQFKQLTGRTPTHFRTQV